LSSGNTELRAIKWGRVWKLPVNPGAAESLSTEAYHHWSNL
jgi:hypothetical protein